MMFFPVKCIACGRCVSVCGTGAATETDLARMFELCTNCQRCVEVCPANARTTKGYYVTARELVEQVEKDGAFYRHSHGGVTLSGGEPLMQPEFVLQFLTECRKRGIHTAVETCGRAKTEAITAIAPYVDLFLYDIKHIDATIHERFTGVGNEQILKNARHLDALGNEMVFRVPVIPGFNDSEHVIEAIADFARSFKNVREIDLIPFHKLGEAKYAALGRDYEYSKHRSIDRGDRRLAAYKDLLESRGFLVQIGG